MEVYINPMLAAGVLKMTEPDNPTSRNQQRKPRNMAKHELAGLRHKGEKKKQRIYAAS